MRQAKPSDAPAIALLLRQAAEAGFGTVGVDEINEARIAEDIAEGLGLRIVVERHGELAGYLKIEPGEYRSLSRTGRLQFAVHRDFRGKGIGAELLRHAVDWAEGGAVDRLEVFVRATNERARKLYRRFGFEEEGRLRARYLGADGRLVDDLVMGRLIEPPLA